MADGTRLHEARHEARRHYEHLADVVRNNLENQQDWTDLHVHENGGDDDGDDDGDNSPTAGREACPRPRILLSGLPPRRMYVHPDEQIAILRAERALGHGRRIPQPPEHEWVLPMHLTEAPTVGFFASVFDAIPALPPGASADGTVDGGAAGGDDDDTQWKAWRGPKRAKRLLLAIVQDDSSVVYYFMHDGIVKPRQN